MIHTKLSPANWEVLPLGYPVDNVCLIKNTGLEKKRRLLD